MVKAGFDSSQYFRVEDLNTEEQLNTLPKTLQAFLQALVPRRSKVDYSPAISFLGQSLMHLISNHYQPPLHVALGTTVHSKTQSQYVIDLLHRYGVCVSSYQTRDFERCAAVTKIPEAFHEGDGFEMKCPLYSADNVDIMKTTLTGSGTYHGMGMIFSHISSRPFPTDTIRRRKVSSEEILSHSVKLKSMPNSFTEFSKLRLESFDLSQKYLPLPVDLLRTGFTFLNPRSLTPQISGVMNIVTKSNHCPGKHFIEYLPIIDLPSTNKNCMFTALDFIIDHHRAAKLPGKPVIGFDQPLWKLGMEVKLKMALEVVLLLGNFHLQMSFLGSIGYVMANSGLSEALATVYGDEPLKKIMNGKSYDRAMRAHSLATTALKEILLEQAYEEDRYAIESASELFVSLLEDNDTPLDVGLLKDSPIVQNLIEVVGRVGNDLSSGTNGLFLEYIKMFDILLRNLHAERLGNWSEYLISLKHMLPYFAGTGHRAYTRSVSLFIQEMDNLDDFTKQQFESGGFVVRRTEKPYAGVSVDLAIEQSLMASIKGNEGLTRGRRFDELQHLIWVLSRPVVSKIDVMVKKMTNLEYHTHDGQSHANSAKYEGKARLLKDQEHMKLIKAFFSERCIFDKNVKDPEVIMSIGTGMIAPQDVNVNKVREIGTHIIQSMIGEHPFDVPIRKADLSVQIPAKFISKTVAKNGMSKVIADPQLLFQRALNLASSEEEIVTLHECLSYELYPVALSLFDEKGFIRQSAKADLAKFLLTSNVFLSSEEGENMMKNSNYAKVFDGGAMLYRVGWTKNDTLTNIFKEYCHYVQNLTGVSSDIHIVFDGYDSNSTKDHCHKKRSPIESLQINFTDLHRPLLCKKDVFLANKVNKQNFVNALGVSLQENERIKVQHTPDDADTTIVARCMQCLQHSDTILIGDDTDLIVLCLHFYRVNAPTKSLCIYRPSSKTNIDVKKVIHQWPIKIMENILVIHAASGCDTVSALSGIGKTKLIKLALKPEQRLCEALTVFNQGDQDRAALVQSGLTVIRTLYCPSNPDISYGDLRE